MLHSGTPTSAGQRQRSRSPQPADVPLLRERDWENDVPCSSQHAMQASMAAPSPEMLASVPSRACQNTTRAGDEAADIGFPRQMTIDCLLKDAANAFTTAREDEAPACTQTTVTCRVSAGDKEEVALAVGIPTTMMLDVGESEWSCSAAIDYMNGEVVDSKGLPAEHLEPDAVHDPTEICTSTCVHDVPVEWFEEDTVCLSETRQPLPSTESDAGRARGGDSLTGVLSAQLWRVYAGGSKNAS